MALPAVTVRGQSVVGATALELRHAKSIQGSSFTEALSERSLNSARTLPRGEYILPLPVDSTDELLLAVQSAFPTHDFGRIPTTQPHQTAVSVRTASIRTALDNALHAFPDATAISLIGPSYAQYAKVREAFPRARVTIFQPMDSARDVQRWHRHRASIHESAWTESTAISADLIFSFFSIGGMHAEEFARAAIVAKAECAYVLHHLAPQAIFGSEYFDPILNVRFQQRGDELKVAFGDAPSYTDSAASIRSWLTCDFQIPAYGFFADVLVDISSVKLLKITMAPGGADRSTTELCDFSDAFHVLPATREHAVEIIPTKLWEPTLDYAQRQRADLLTPEIVRNRISSLKHKVSIGSAVIQSAIFCSDRTADHLAEVAVEVVKIRNQLALEKEALIQRGIECRASRWAPLAELNDRTHGMLGVAEVAARTYYNVLTAPTRFFGLTKGVQYGSAIPATDNLTLREKAEQLFDSRINRLEVLQATVRSAFLRTPVSTRALTAKLRALRIQARVDRASRDLARFWIRLLASLLPREVRWAAVRSLLFILDRTPLLPSFLRGMRQMIRSLAHAIPVGENFMDRFLDLIFQHFEIDRLDIPVPFRSGPRLPLSEVSSSTSSSSSSSSSSPSFDEEGDQEAVLLSTIEEELGGSEEVAVQEAPRQRLNPDTNEYEDAPMEELLGGEPSLPLPVEDETTGEHPSLEDEEVGRVGAEEEPAPFDPHAAASPHELTGIINLRLPLSHVFGPADPLLDQACTLPPIEDFAVDRSNLKSKDGQSTETSFVCGPNSLKRHIVFGLTTSHGKGMLRQTQEELKRNIRELREGKTKQKAGSAKINSSNRMAECLEALNTVPEAFKKIDVVVSGLPAAGKSSVIIPLIGDEDVLVVPTTELAKKWKLDLAAAGKRNVPVLTQHALLHPDYAVNRFRVVWIDEAFLLEAAHLAQLIRKGVRSVALGDGSQISAFHVRQSVAKYPLKRGLARVWIEAPYSLGLPEDVLVLGKKLGFLSARAVTFNRTQALEYLDEKPTFEAPSRDSINIVFNQANITESVSITAHSSQGSRPKIATIRVHQDEASFCPNTAHFWVALTRATERVRLWLCAEAQVAFDAQLALAVQGHIRNFAGADALPFNGSIAHESCIAKLQNASTAQIMAEFGLSAESYEFLVHDVPTPIELGVARDGFDLTTNQINAALREVNRNEEGIKYSEAVDMHEMVFDRDLTTDKFSALLDLQASQKEATSTLEKAGVYFGSDDTKTEFFTITTRYLMQPQQKSEDPVELARQLLERFEIAYIDPAKTSVQALPRAASFNDWINSRTPSLFQPDTSVFAEESHTTTFSSFLKAHAKAKNDPGFGTKQEKGQTIAAGHQSYNARHTSVCREAQNILQQIKYDHVFVDIGYSDEEFEAFAVENELCSATNTQIDLSSQDSTHFEHTVLALVMFLLKYTSMTPDEALEYTTMRSRYTVRAANFQAKQRLRYEVTWFLPSGDPYTLFANCFMEMSAIAFVFILPPCNTRQRAICFKGDDTYAKFLLLLLLFFAQRAELLGVLMKIDQNLPPFFAGRYILPDNSVHHDPIKHAAKYSVKRFDPTRIPDYVQAYRVLLPPVSPYHDELLLRYGMAHHPTMHKDSIEILTIFARSLATYPGFLRFQNFSKLSEQIVDPPSNCARAVCGALKLPKPRADPTPWEFERHLKDLGVEYIFRPKASRIELRAIALRAPLRAVFSLRHAVCYLPGTRYSTPVQNL